MRLKCRHYAVLPPATNTTDFPNSNIRRSLRQMLLIDGNKSNTHTYKKCASRNSIWHHTFRSSFGKCSLRVRWRGLATYTFATTPIPEHRCIKFSGRLRWFLYAQHYSLRCLESTGLVYGFRYIAGSFEHVLAYYMFNGRKEKLTHTYNF